MSRTPSGLACALVLVAALGGALPAAADGAELIVRRDAGLSRAERLQVRADAGVRFARSLAVPDAEVVTVPAGQREVALAALEADPAVRYAEPVATFSVTGAGGTNDPEWDTQWGLQNTGQPIYRFSPGTEGADIDAPQAWDVTRGAGQTVGVVDTGIDLEEPDLADRLAPGGRSFVPGAPTPDDDNGHGTEITGIIAATADNEIGVAGVAPEAMVVPIKALKADGSGTADAVGDALAYAGDLGLRVVNASISTPSYSQYVRDAIASHPDTLYVTSAGNGGDDDVGDDNDADDDGENGPQYPCNLPLANVICVSASDRFDGVPEWANHGAKSVDLFAPGSLIMAIRDGTYALDIAGGTSLASAFVAGEAALLAAAHPSLTPASLRQLILENVTGLAAAPPTVTGGRANAGAALHAEVLDEDGDGVLDALDNCVSVANTDQRDLEGDGIGDACDPDTDGDGTSDANDRCPTVAGAGSDGCPITPPGDDDDDDDDQGGDDGGGGSSQTGGSTTKQLDTSTQESSMPTRPRITSLRVRLTPKACPRRTPRCGKTARVTVKVSQQTKVAVKVERRVKSRHRWVWRRVRSKSLLASARGRTLVVRGKRGKPTSRYRVTATITGATKAVSFRV